MQKMDVTQQGLTLFNIKVLLFCEKIPDHTWYDLWQASEALYCTDLNPQAEQPKSINDVYYNQNC